jgi:hypothetical protein
MPVKKAIIALAYRLSVIIADRIATGQPCQDLGATYHDLRDRTQIVPRAGRRLETLGCRVPVEPPGLDRSPDPPSGGLPAAAGKGLASGILRPTCSLIGGPVLLC